MRFGPKFSRPIKAHEQKYANLAEVKPATSTLAFLKLLPAKALH